MHGETLKLIFDTLPVWFTCTVYITAYWLRWNYLRVSSTLCPLIYSTPPHVL